MPFCILKGAVRVQFTNVISWKPNLNNKRKKMKRVFVVMTIAFVLLSFNNQPRKKIIFFGDSITQAGIGKDGYITKLDSICKAKDKNYELVGAGISGHRVENLYNRLEKDVLSKNPDAVVIWIGVNDVWHGKFVTDSHKLMFSKYYTSILQQLKDKNTKVIMCTPGVVGEKKGMVNKLDAGLNECADSIRAIAKRFHCPLVDLRKDFVKYDEKHNDANADKGILTSDGVHLNRAGNLFVAEKMWAVIKKKVK
jgi:lysophospholipase L1-like esterase